jgi:hypothetical protein
MYEVSGGDARRVIHAIPPEERLSPVVTFHLYRDSNSPQYWTSLCLDNTFSLLRGCFSTLGVLS